MPLKLFPWLISVFFFFSPFLPFLYVFDFNKNLINTLFHAHTTHSLADARCMYLRTPSARIKTLHTECLCVDCTCTTTYGRLRNNTHSIHTTLFIKYYILNAVRARFFHSCAVNVALQLKNITFRFTDHRGVRCLTGVAIECHRNAVIRYRKKKC